eukprot:CAMPEP_0206183870 /NCGR_PEP_ID=MMETSP0166-20121206/894_1 /ASSEMBLY_ACC=CAM_ASM_000260 /TAXON_ID=95228 /ORGANISM="Vannella robusta, Strain DIVA3 518/3/11/1/6" /LENGTH=457 /DNA_ID=CAMNT_0053598805 /DNA_START=68 /DNA_END=1438 /DNA_ORIENTATION=+
MGINLLNPSSLGYLEFPNVSTMESTSYGCTLGKRKGFAFSRKPLALPPAKQQCSSSLIDEEWHIAYSNARKPNLDVIRSRNGKITVSNISLMPLAKAKIYRTYGFQEGEGTYGSVFRVIDSAFPDRELVMKISLANSNFFAEVSALHALNHERKTPNIPTLHDWFISDQLPPDNRYWSSVSEKIRNAPQFKNLFKTKSPFGYLVLEKANAGSLSNFSQNHISNGTPPQEIWKMIDTILFQLVFTAAALPESAIIHRDIGGSNIMLTAVDDPNRWWYFRVGKQLFRFLRPTVKPVLIDYGSAHILEVGSSMKTDFRFTTLRYRAPEMIFLSSSPSGLLQPVFAPPTDLFSIALSILEMILGDFTAHSRGNKYQNHPFLRHDPPPLLAMKLKELSQKLKTDENDLSLDYVHRTWAGTLHSGFITVDEGVLMARYIWGMYIELGIPNNRKWPGVEETSIW